MGLIHWVLIVFKRFDSDLECLFLIQKALGRSEPEPLLEALSRS
jgi:hypothetical protein